MLNKWISTIVSSPCITENITNNNWVNNLQSFIIVINDATIDIQPVYDVYELNLYINTNQLNNCYMKQEYSYNAFRKQNNNINHYIVQRYNNQNYITRHIDINYER